MLFRSLVNLLTVRVIGIIGVFVQRVLDGFQATRRFLIIVGRHMSRRIRHALKLTRFTHPAAVIAVSARPCPGISRRELTFKTVITITVQQTAFAFLGD